jgi:hypothetical protein
LFFVFFLLLLSFSSSFLVFSEASQIEQAARLLHVLFLTLTTAAVGKTASPCWIPAPCACLLRGAQGTEDIGWETLSTSQSRTVPSSASLAVVGAALLAPQTFPGVALNTFPVAGCAFHSRG